MDPDGRLASEATKDKFRNVVYGFYDSGRYTYLTVPVDDEDAFVRAFDIYTGPIAEKLAKSSLKLGQAEFNTIITNTIANIIGTEFDCYFDSFLQ